MLDLDKHNNKIINISDSGQKKYGINYHPAKPNSSIGNKSFYDFLSILDKIVDYCSWINQNWGKFRLYSIAITFLVIIVYLSIYVTTNNINLKNCTYFVTPVTNTLVKSPYINYNLDPYYPKSRSSDIIRPHKYFYVYKPKGYDPTKNTKYGLVVFAPNQDVFNKLDTSWQEVLDRQNLFLIAPQNIGPSAGPDEVYNSLILAGLEMKKNYPIDENNIFLVGFSRNARACSDLGFYQPDLFDKIVCVCGADFYRKVNTVKACTIYDTKGSYYGLINATASEIETAKKSVSFLFITGDKDFRQGNILDIFENGYMKDGFSATLFDIDGMSHELIEGSILAKALKTVSDYQILIHLDQ